ncbi:hypothetical protein JVU11DRAFT_6522 [Chiua virens]|nr:hypothetical protein JVU11DRAFT_6522 [Chiua virens]
MYAQRFDIVPQGNHNSLVEHTTGLHILKRAMWASGIPLGGIFPFGNRADEWLSSTNCLHLSQAFFLNKYFDKDFFYAITGC